jgi:beta-glucanase (GH16 family)
MPSDPVTSKLGRTPKMCYITAENNLLDCCHKFKTDHRGRIEGLIQSMKKPYSSLLVFLFSLCQLASAQNYQLVWSDEFNGSQVNTSIWDIRNDGNVQNNELEYYTNRPSNLTVSNGTLVITALKEEYGGRHYTSARLSTKLSWLYGRIEARMKLPYGQGLWPAFWMLGANINSIGWPACGEIDIMEMIGGISRSNPPGGDNYLFGTAHWATSNGSHTQYPSSSNFSNYRLPSGGFSDDYHIFSMTWTPSKLTWYVDGIQYCSLDTSPVGLSAFRTPFFILLNLAVGGSWPGSPDASTLFPQTLEVDYVRVYQDVATSVGMASSGPRDFVLFPNYPNPFNPTTAIRFQLIASSFVTLRVYDIYGREVALLVNGQMDTGVHSVNWIGTEAPSGVYFCRLTAGSNSMTKKMTLLR